MTHNYDPREPREFTSFDDNPFNNGWREDETRGPYYGRVSDNSDEIDEEEDWENDNSHEGA